MIALEDMSAGSTLGRYELLLPIAQGGMAAVWAARMKGTRGFQKIVAIKTILPALSDDPQFEDMFLLEAQLASRIRHPNVCQILDLGEEEGTLFLVMEWIEGEALNAINRAARPRGGVPVGVATRIGIAAATGLHAAHEVRGDDGQLVGLVHRDVSPQNVLVTYDGVVKIVDFGVAKAAAAFDGRTKAGQLKGKVPFMSPEQALGRAVDRRSDVFSLGIILRQLIARKHPFRDNNEAATIHRICEPAPLPPLRSVAPHCPVPICLAVDKALEKNPANRHATMLDFARALEAGLAALPAPARDMDVASFVRSTVGEHASKRKAAIQQATTIADARATEATRASVTGTFAAVVRPSEANPWAASSGSSPSGVRPSSQSLSDTDASIEDAFARNVRPRRGRRALFVFAAAAVIAGGAYVRQSIGSLFDGAHQAHAEAPPLVATAPASTATPGGPPPTADPAPPTAPAEPISAAAPSGAPDRDSTAAVKRPQPPPQPARGNRPARPARPGGGSTDPSGAFQFRDPGF